ncbi:hypothetical protein LCGC14_1282180 [marine sediment metagenome]|uniref:Phage tail tape measure protein domain-containing protein n=1 Tax=marine sediment metagenome TaxID=412755 RepID=A0A0F9LFY0_9ZZZZ
MPNRDIIFTLKFRNQAGQVIRKFGAQLKGLGDKGKVAARGLDKLALKFRKLGDSVTKAGRRIKTAGASIREAGTNIAFSIGVPIAAAVAISIKAFADFDLALAGVQKTVQGTPEQLAGLEQEFIKLSNAVPIAATQLANIAQTAGQLGIAIPDIAAFTETIAKVGVATKLSTEQAAFALARLSNIMQIPTSQVNNLASSLIALGNNFEANETEILNLATRLAKAGKVVNLTAGEVLGLSTALAAVGVRAQAGGTAVSKALVAMSKAVELGGEKVAQFAETAGLSVAEFSRLFREDAASAFEKFIVGLGKTIKSGKGVFTVMEDLGLQASRTQRAIIGLALASGKLKQALDLGNKAFIENTALNREAEIFFAALSSQMVILRNRFKNAAAILGKSFGPVIVEIIETLGAFALKLQDFAKRMEDLPIATKRWIVVLLGALIALGPLLIGLGSFVLIIGATVAAFGPFLKGMGFLITFVKNAALAMRALTLAMLTNPFVFAAVAVAALVALFIKFKDSVVKIGGTTQSVMDFTIGLFEALRQKIGEVIAGELKVLQKVWTKIANAAIIAFNFLTPIFANVFNFLRGIAITTFDAMGSISKAVVNAMIKGIQLASLAYRTTFRIITILVSNAFGIISEKMEGLTDVVVGLAEPFIDVFHNIGGFIKDQFELITGTVGKFFGVVQEGLEDLAGRAKGKAVAGLEQLKIGIVNMAKAADDTKLLKGIPDAIQAGVEEAQKILASDPFGAVLELAAEFGGKRFAARLEALIDKEKPVSKGLGKDLEDAGDLLDDKGPELGASFGAAFKKGFNNALREFAKEAGDIAQLSQDAFKNAFDNIETALLDFVETGKFNFRDLAQSIMREFNKIAIKSILGDLALKMQGEDIAPGGFLSGVGKLFGSGSEEGALGVAGEAVGGASEAASTAAMTAGFTTLGATNTAGFTTLGTTTATGFASLATANASGFAGIAAAIAASAAASSTTDALGEVAGTLSAVGSEGGISQLLPKKKFPAGIFANAKRFAQGGVTSGRDTIPAMLSPNEAVIPLSRNRAIPIEGNTGNTIVNINVQATDVESFRRSESQTLARFGSKMVIARRRTQ